jgi:cytochrome b
MATQCLPDAVVPRKIRVWDLPLRLFHWLLVGAVATAFLSSEESSPLADFHILSGWIVAVLIIFRVVWGFVGGEHSRWSDFMRPAGLAAHVRELAHLRPAAMLGHNPVGAVSVLALLALASAVVWTGVTLRDEDLHEFLAWTLLALIGVHILGVLVMSILCRENLAGAMITGQKPAARHPGARDARRPPWYGLLLAALAIGGAVYAIRLADPLAFAPRSTESYEHGAKGETARESRGNADRQGEHERGRLRD